ncbi:MAG: DNA-3-methyladenine glycosylase [Patescibacteria group bacterium]|nr:DNA-3-methyladenine glycosylase [Patescibacteria group bacterium]
MSELQQLLEQMDAPDAARWLLGCELIRTFGNETARVRIVETEAYHQTDAASHSYTGQTPRTDVMFGPAGRLYVYFTYGMHYCCNVVIGREGEGSAVLIRAVEPLEGESVLLSNRNKPGRELTNGPAKLCQSLLIDRALNGHDLNKSPLQLIVRPKLSAADITQTSRIGLSKAVETPWRFYVTGNPYVSKI